MVEIGGQIAAMPDHFGGWYHVDEALAYLTIRSARQAGRDPTASQGPPTGRGTLPTRVYLRALDTCMR